MNNIKNASYFTHVFFCMTIYQNFLVKIFFKNHALSLWHFQGKMVHLFFFEKEVLRSIFVNNPDDQ